MDQKKHPTQNVLVLGVAELAYSQLWSQRLFSVWRLPVCILIYWNQYCLLAVQCRSDWTGLSSLRRNYGYQCPLKNGWRCHWPDSQNSENIVCHDRREKRAIFPDGKDSSPNRYGQFFSVSRIDQSHRQYRCDRESDQSYVEELP